MTKLFVGLGLICGLAGYLAVGKLGGSRTVWLVGWETLVVMHIAFSAAAHYMQGISVKATGADVASMYGKSSNERLTAAMWLVLGLVLPYLIGTLTFRM